MSMKFAKKSLAIAIAAGLAGGMAGVAQAGKIGIVGPAATTTPDQYAYMGTFTLSAEAVAGATAGYAIDLDTSATNAKTPTGRQTNNIIGATTALRYCPEYGMSNNDTLTFTFSGAKYTGASAVLLVEELAAAQVNIGANLDVAGDGGGPLVAPITTPLTAFPPTGGVDTFQLRVNSNGLSTQDGVCLVLAEGDNQGAAAANVCDTASTAGQISVAGCSPSLLVNAGATGNVTVSVAAQGLSGAVPAGSATNTLFNIVPQLQFAIPMPATSVADVGAATPRTLFLDEAGAGVLAAVGDDTDKQSSSAEYTLTNGKDNTVFATPNAIIEDAFVLDAADSVTFTLTPSGNDVGGVVAKNGAVVASLMEMGPGGAGTAGDPDIPFTVGTMSLTATQTGAQVNTALPVTAAPAVNAAMPSVTDDMVIGIDGMTAIEDRTWSATAAFNFAAEGDVTLGPVTSHIWTNNGTILNFPFMTISPSMIASRFVVVNTGAMPVSYTAQVIAPASTGNATPATVTNGMMQTGTVPANSSFAIQAADVLAGLSAGTRAAVRITVAGPGATIRGAYQMVNPGGIQTVYTAN